MLPNVAGAEPVVACTLGAAELADTTRRWETLRRRAALEPVLNADGIRLAFRDEAGVEVELRALVEMETDCCAWANWTVARKDGLIVLDVRSAGSGIPALHGMFAQAT